MFTTALLYPAVSTGSLRRCQVYKMNEWVNEWMLLPALKHFSTNWLVKIIKRLNPPTHYVNIKILDLHKNKNAGVTSNDLSIYPIQQFFSIEVWAFIFRCLYSTETRRYPRGYNSSLHTPVHHSKSSMRSSNFLEGILCWSYRKSLRHQWEVPIWRRGEYSVLIVL